jgi:2,4-dienoyl-CoA reductase-like NADH-dependent reductase (Old Yellow Enzyme family)
MAPMTRTFCPGGVPNDKVVEYYRRRAAAGVGLIITEGTTVGHKAANGYPNVPRFHGEDALAGWKRVVDAVHAEGGQDRAAAVACGQRAPAGHRAGCQRAGPRPERQGQGRQVVVHGMTMTTSAR